MIRPYKRSPEPPRMAVLVSSTEALDEDGRWLDVHKMHRGVQIWASQDKVHELLSLELGEALTWNFGRFIRWRPRPWVGDPQRFSVSVVNATFPTDLQEQLRHLARWRDWLSEYGAAPNNSVGSASMSLLRASLDGPLYTSGGTLPPIRWVSGARQELGPAGKGEYPDVQHYDYHAAYAKELGELEYGGQWYHGTGRRCDNMVAGMRGGVPGFVRAFVRTPRGSFGALLDRPDERPRVPGLTDRPWYPRGKALWGVWTWQELEAAVEFGAKILRIADAWIHVPHPDNPRPFGTWWDRVQVGRSMYGFSGMLAKMTGNALWGQFCVTAYGGQRRQIIRYQLRQGTTPRRIVQTPDEQRGSRPPALDLAETITGRVRARAYRFMETAGDGLISCHTDGGWVADGIKCELRGMRKKGEAHWIKVLGPQALQYLPRGADVPLTIMSGWPMPLATDFFNRLWKERQ